MDLTQGQLLDYGIIDVGIDSEGYGFEYDDVEFQLLLAGASTGAAEAQARNVPPSTPPPAPVSPVPVPPTVSAPSSALVATSIARRNQRQQNRMERRGHTKSRRGCFNCKRRRIKCQETEPACGHCVKTGLQCVYPSTPQVVHQPHSQIPLFSLQDMRFFQHFLLDCYPAHPLGNENTWTHEIPCLSHNHDYLMHAILGCSASDLLKRTNQQGLLVPAMTHRFRAIRAIKKRLSEIPRRGTTAEEANAMLATCFALTFQSTLLDDGAAEFMTFIRGIVIVSMQMWFKGIRPLFRNLEASESDAILAPRMAVLPLIDPGWSAMAVASLELLAPVCAAADADGLAAEYCAALLAWARELLVSSLGAYRLLKKQYGWWMMQPHPRFARIIDMDDQVMVLLASHWVALQLIMVFVLEVEQEGREKEPPARGSDGRAKMYCEDEDVPEQGVDLGMGRWLRCLGPLVEPANRHFNAFPEWVLGQIERDPTFFGKSR